MAAFLASLACHLRYALLILCVVVMLILMSKWTGTGTSVVVKEKQACDTVSSKLLTEAREYADAPRNQFGEQVSELLHSSTALAYLQAAQMVNPKALSEKELALQQALTQRQQAAVQALVPPPLPSMPMQSAQNGADPNFFSPLYR